MLPKGTMAIVAEALAKIKFNDYCTTLDIDTEKLAKIKFDKHCDNLDEIMNKELRKTFKTERISEERITRIIENFNKNLKEAAND